MEKEILNMKERIYLCVAKQNGGYKVCQGFLEKTVSRGKGSSNSDQKRNGLTGQSWYRIVKKGGWWNWKTTVFVGCPPKKCLEGKNLTTRGLSEEKDEGWDREVIEVDRRKGENNNW